jgi:hypothetical protein
VTSSETPANTTKRVYMIQTRNTQNRPNRTPLQHQIRTAAAPPSSKTTLKPLAQT